MLHNHSSADKANDRPDRSRIRAVTGAGALSLVMGALSLTAAPAAQAAFPQSATARPCTVTAKLPYHNGEFSGGGKKIVVYPVEVTCSHGGVRVQMDQQLREADGGDDPYQRDYFTPAGTPLVFSEAGTQTVHTTYRLTETDDWGPADVYHKVRFRVVSLSNGVSSPLVYVQSAEREIWAH